MAVATRHPHIGHSAKVLAELINAYTITRKPNTITVPNAKQLAALRDVTIKGKLIKKQLVNIEDDGKTRNFREPSRGGGQYTTEPNDGDIHFCLGTDFGEVHIPNELQHGADWVQYFNDAIDTTISVSGFFRCLFEHPGFQEGKGADAHIFEIHPVRAVDFGTGILGFDVDVPDEPSIHPWSQDINDADTRPKVAYDPSADTFTFTHIPGRDHNYMRVDGTVTNIKLNAGSMEPSEFTFTSSDITDENGPRPVWVECLKATSASRQLEALPDGAQVTLVGLRNIVLSEALNNKYVTNMLAIDIQSA
jgi:hypothetical protein